MTLSSGSRLGAYEVLAPLGKGGMGEVYRAKDPRLDREVAVKVLPEEFFEGEERRQRFGREARLLAALNHPGIAAVYKRTDVWAFGCVLYEMLTGKRAFAGETVSDTLAAILTKEPDWAALTAQTPTRIRDLLRRCLRREAKQRLHDIADARLELEELSAGAASSASGYSPFEEKTVVPNPTVASAERASRERGNRKNSSLFLPWALAAAFAAAAGALALRARAPQSDTRPLRLAFHPPDGITFDPGGAHFAMRRA